MISTLLTKIAELEQVVTQQIDGLSMTISELLSERNRLGVGRGKRKMILLMHLTLNGTIYPNRYVRYGADAGRSFAQKNALRMTYLGKLLIFSIG
jgi:hypothetical protein